MDSALVDVVERIRDASAQGTALRIRGGGTRDFLGERLQGDILDTRALRGVVAYEPSELVVTVRAGTPLAQLEATLGDSGQCLPFEPPHFGAGATVGGMVASGLSGPARASAGAVRDYVLGVNLVNGKGEELVFGGQVMKNVAGYDVSRLMVGAFGTLGLITQVSLKVLGTARTEATLRFEMTQQQALASLNTWGGQPLPLNASVWVDQQGVGMLHLRLRGATAAVEAACATLGGERVDAAQATAFWQLCREQRHAWFEERGARDLWRLSVPQTAPVLDLPEPPLIEWHGAQRWVRAGERGKEAGGEAVGEGTARRLREAATRVGGHATLFRTSAGTARLQPLAAPLAAIHRELKRQFDPAGIFNRGRLYPDF